MTTSSIKCPKCGEDIPLDETRLTQIKSEIAPELRKELKVQIDDFKERNESLVREKASYDKQVDKEAEVRAEKKLKEHSANIRAEEKERVNLEVKEQAAENESLKKTNIEYEEKILAEQKRTRTAENAKKDGELALAGKLRENETEVRKQAAEENILKNQKHKEELLGKDKTISDMTKKLEEAQNTGALGSQQLQGEVKEISLKDFLGDAFPPDELSDVPTGTPGGDVIQKVLGPTGEPCGTILWESKDVKNWSKAWITKLKGDQLEAKAEVAILYTSVMPKDVTDHYACIDDVHVVNRLTLLPVATTLRSSLIAITRTKVSEEGKDMKHVMLYNYLTSSEFSQRIGMMLTTYTEEREHLGREQRQATKNFKIRETLLLKNEENLISIFSRFKGIAGASIPEIEALEPDLKGLPESTDRDPVLAAEE